jgi:O-antigen/teichoic acid export membrane protein
VVVDMAQSSGFRRAVLTMGATSLLVPLVGIATAPILAQALGVDGRGEVAAAMAPNALIVSAATLGLPEALTFHLATRPHLTRRALLWANLVSAALGGAAFVLTMVFAGFLSGGDAELGDLILLGAALAVPLLAVNLLRGAAIGRAMWRTVALERIINSVLRLGGLAGFALTGSLDVLTAVVIVAVAPVLGGLAYLPLLGRPPQPDEPSEVNFRTAPALLGYGSQVWVGAIAGMLTAKLGQLLITPLSSVEQLGLFVVAVTVADVPYIISTAVREVVFGLDSRERNASRLATTSRLATLVCLVVSIGIAITLPFWIEFVFGSGFGDALPATLILLAAAVVNIPGVMTGTGLSAWGRPALRTAGLLVALIGNLVGLVLLVPPMGALGAALATLIASAAGTVFCVAIAVRVVGLPASAFLVIRPSDFVLLWREAARMIGRMRGRGRTDSAA